MTNNYQFYNYNNINHQNNMYMNTTNNNNTFMNNMNFVHSYSMNNINNRNNMNLNNNMVNNNNYNNYMNNVNNINYMANNNNHIIYKNNNNNYITVIFVYNKTQIALKVNVKTKISTLIKAYRENAKIYAQNIQFYFNEIELNPNLSVEGTGLQQNSIILVKDNGRVDECLTLSHDIRNNRVDECLTISNKTNNNIIPECLTIPIDTKNNRVKENYTFSHDPNNTNRVNNSNNNINIPLSQTEKIINIKFIKQPKDNNYIPYSYIELHGLLKLCLLKEISPKLNDYQIKQLPEIVAKIMKILKFGYSNDSNIQKNIKDVLEKMRGSNIISFSSYVNEIINSNELNNITNLLKNDELNEINDIKNRLSIYNEHTKQFEIEFEKAKRNSIFEFSIVSLVIIEREEYIKFEKGKNNCPNIVDKILFHGTNIDPISNILTGYFNKSKKKGTSIFGEGVYFTDLLDYCWYYGGPRGNRENINKIPKINDTFTLIACSTYYDQKGFRRVKDNKYTPKKNEINFAYVGSGTEALINPDKRKFYGTEYVIWDLDQICPFISAKLERQEYCIIWRDTNFTSKPIHFNEFDNKFKKFLKEKIKYIEQIAKYNVYPCETTEEALNLIRRKKYNKIILISNAGGGGREFVIEARKIIGNNVIALFVAYMVDHLKWIKDFPNSFFSNESSFDEKYIECFNDTNTDNVKKKINTLIKSMENHYQVRFNFNDKYLYFPLYEESMKKGKYSDLTF